MLRARVKSSPAAPVMVVSTQVNQFDWQRTLEEMFGGDEVLKRKVAELERKLRELTSQPARTAQLRYAFFYTPVGGIPARNLTTGQWGKALCSKQK